MRRLAAASMLAAVFALVLHGALAAVAMAVPAGAPMAHAAHVDCDGHAGPMSHAASAHDHAAHADRADRAVPVPAGTERAPPPGRQVDCCTTVAAAVVPPVDLLEGPDFVAVRFAPEPASFLEGLPPAAPSEPPRPTYPV